MKARGVSRRAVAIAPVLLLGCSPAKKPIKRYTLRGEVKRLEKDRMVAVIKHEKIGDWMEAMTMEFPVRDKAEFAKLAEGKQIKATVEVQDLDYWLTSIEAQ